MGGLWHNREGGGGHLEGGGALGSTWRVMEGCVGYMWDGEGYMEGDGGYNGWSLRLYIWI